MKEEYYWKYGRRIDGYMNGPYPSLDEARSAAMDGYGYDRIIGEKVYNDVPMPNVEGIIDDMACNLNDIVEGGAEQWLNSIGKHEIAELQIRIDAAFSEWMSANNIPTSIAGSYEVEIINGENLESIQKESQ